jgi:hypothetical protein
VCTLNATRCWNTELNQTTNFLTAALDLCLQLLDSIILTVRKREVAWFELFTAVIMKSIFWNITPCSPLKDNRCFGVLTICFHAVIFLGLCYSEDGGDMFPRNVCWLSTDYIALCPRRSYSARERWSNFSGKLSDKATGNKANTLSLVGRNLSPSYRDLVPVRNGVDVLHSETEKGIIILWNICTLYDQPPINLSVRGPSPIQISHLHLCQNHKMCGKFTLWPPYYFIASCLGTKVAIVFPFILHLKSR